MNTKQGLLGDRNLRGDALCFSANDDYVGISDTLEFAPGITEQTLKVTILDDLGNPLLEGPETFELLLRMPINAVLGTPERVVVVINDTESDREFKSHPG